MTPETEAQIRNVRKFGGYAHSVSGIAGAFLVINVDVMLARRKMRLNELAERGQR